MISTLGMSRSVTALLGGGLRGYLQTYAFDELHYFNRKLNFRVIFVLGLITGRAA